jgi:hypothetical protein
VWRAASWESGESNERSGVCGRGSFDTPSRFCALRSCVGCGRPFAFFFLVVVQALTVRRTPARASEADTVDAGGPVPHRYRALRVLLLVSRLLAVFLMEREKKRFGVGIEAPDVPLWSDDEMRTCRVQVDPQYLPLRKTTDLLCVLDKARAIPGVDEVLLAQLRKWSERDGISAEKIATASLSDEEGAYIASISPSLDSLRLRDSSELAVLIRVIVDKKLVPWTAQTGLSVAGELKRIDFMKSSARKKCRN